MILYPTPTNSPALDPQPSATTLTKRLYAVALLLDGTTDPVEVESLKAIALRASADLVRALGVET